jgi:mannan endo-1,4-beta-mannosidase
VRFWDEFIHLAERHGLYLLLTPYDTFWQVHHWANYSYQRVVEHKHDWLTSPDSIAAHKQRWEFVIKRWGGSPNILAWDLMNEIELYWGATPEEIEAYITEMATFVRQLEVKTWGRTHMLTVSSASATPSGKLGNVIYNHPELDFANTHLYVGLGIRAPIDAIEGAEEMIDGVQLSLQAIHRTRPYLDTESGPIDQWISDLTLDQKYHHHLSWAHLISGGAGSGMRWPYTQPHWLLPEFRQNLLGLARFATAVDWVNFNSRPINGLRLGKPGILKTGCTDGKTALLWLLRDTRLENPPSLSGVHVHIPYVLTDGEYQVELWETTHGILFDQLTAQVTYGKTAFALPELPSELDDIALILRQRQS